MKKLTAMLAGTAFSLSGCETLSLDEPKTLGEINTGYNYIPVDPLAVGISIEPPAVPADASGWTRNALRYARCASRRGTDPKKDPPDVMDALPDHTVRMAMREISGGGNLGFGPVGFTGSGKSYQVVVDSIFADTANVRFAVRIVGVDKQSQSLGSLSEKIADDTVIDAKRLESGENAPAGYEEVTVPVYVGIGLRLTANLFAKKGGFDLGNLGGLAAKAEAEQVSGSLTMQTLGVYNQQVAATYAIPNKLDSTAIENALVALGAVKAIVYDKDTGTRPRITGIYNPLPTSDPKLINKIYSELAKSPVPWQPCDAA
jgi:hypothetical protein